MDELRRPPKRDPRIRTGETDEIEHANRVANVKRSRASSLPPAIGRQPSPVSSIDSEHRAHFTRNGAIRQEPGLPGEANDAPSEGDLEDALRSFLLSQRRVPEEDSRPHDQLFQNRLKTPPRQSWFGPVVDVETSLEHQLQQLFDAGKSAVFHTTHREGNKNEPKTSILNMAALQQMNIHYLQSRIAAHVGRSFTIGTFQPEMDQFRDESVRLDYWMERHCQAVRDMEYMKQRATLDPRDDPFKLMSSCAVERSILQSAGLIPTHVLPAGPLPNAEDHDKPVLHISSRVKAKEAEARDQILRRFGMASLGGLLLLVPVLIMANLPGKLAALVTTSAAMVVFAVLVTWATSLGPNEVLATTAAYAAVLVVFVGTSLAPQAGVT